MANQLNKSLIGKYISPDLVGFFAATSRDQVLKEMVEMAAKAGRLQDVDAFYQALLEREKLVSTGIGMGIAIPHAKIAGYDDFFIAIGVLKDGLDWSSLDGVPVRILFMIGGPDDKQTEYLKILSELTSLLKDEERRKIVLELEEGEDIYRTITEF
ncbi:MAG: hypothetical protein K0S07_1571 [Chlamydiales bacterium]|jgi:PTS system nitrogen regulatory IIA component|nr:hypothetical protein [Chlamydiales bacterium]